MDMQSPALVLLRIAWTCNNIRAGTFLSPPIEERQNRTQLCRLRCMRFSMYKKNTYRFLFHVKIYQYLHGSTFSVLEVKMHRINSMVNFSHPHPSDHEQRAKIDCNSTP
jgi:hypothetical protein